MQISCVWLKGSSRVLSICFYTLTDDCKNYFKQDLLALTLKLRPLYLLSSFAHGIGNFAEGKQLVITRVNGEILQVAVFQANLYNEEIKHTCGKSCCSKNVIFAEVLYKF